MTMIPGGGSAPLQCSRPPAGRPWQSSGGCLRWRRPWLWKDSPPWVQTRRAFSILLLRTLREVKGFTYQNTFPHLTVLVPMLWSLSTTERSMLVTDTSVDTFTLSCRWTESETQQLKPNTQTFIFPLTTNEAGNLWLSKAPHCNGTPSSKRHSGKVWLHALKRAGPFPDRPLTSTWLATSRLSPVTATVNW